MIQQVHVDAIPGLAEEALGQGKVCTQGVPKFCTGLVVIDTLILHLSDVPKEMTNMGDVAGHVLHAAHRCLKCFGRGI
jgi:hypothetical protein